MKEDRGISQKISSYARSFNDNLRATRRTKINGKSVDEKQLTQSQTWDLISKFFESKNERYIELINMEYNKNV